MLRRSARSINPVPASISQNITSAPVSRTAFADATNVLAGTTTVSVLSRLMAIPARCRAAVPLLQLTAYFAPTIPAKVVSKAVTSEPWVSSPSFMTLTTAAMSSSSMEW